MLDPGRAQGSSTFTTVWWFASISAARWPRWGEFAARASTKKQLRELHPTRSASSPTAPSHHWIPQCQGTHNCSELYVYGVLSMSRYPAPWRKARHAAKQTLHCDITDDGTSAPPLSNWDDVA